MHSVDILFTETGEFNGTALLQKIVICVSSPTIVKKHVFLPEKENQLSSLLVDFFLKVNTSA